MLAIAQLLERQGYREVRLLGRKGFVGRNRSGGWDLEAVAPGHQALVPVEAGFKCIIQVKQFDDLAVQQRTVDELRGCILRAGAGVGLLITTSRFSPVAQEAAQASSLAPVILLNGERLVSLLIQQRLGVCQKPNGKWTIDPEYFRSMREVETGHAQEAAVKEEVKRAGKRNQDRLFSSHAIASYAPENRQVPSYPPPKRHVLHFSIVLNADPLSRHKPGKERSREC